MKKKTAYFAHSMKIYNTQIETEQFEFIKTRFNGKVICPNKELGELGDVKAYIEVVKKCSILYITEYQKMIGRGVYLECKSAIENNIPILVVRKDVDGVFYILEVKDVERTCYSDLVRFGIVKTK